MKIPNIPFIGYGGLFLTSLIHVYSRAQSVYRWFFIGLVTVVTGSAIHGQGAIVWPAIMVDTYNNSKCLKFQSQSFVTYGFLVIFFVDT